METIVFSENTAIDHLQQMRENGYIGDDLEQYIDTHFEYDENLCRAYVIIEDRLLEVENPILVEVVELINTIYSSKQLDQLLSIL